MQLRGLLSTITVNIQFYRDDKPFSFGNENKFLYFCVRNGNVNPAIGL
jgi:hypothetical protein